MRQRIGIIGAGLSGLIAAAMIPDSHVYEVASKRINHSALLRFRTRNVPEAIGIPFKEVKVIKSCYGFNGHTRHPTIAEINQYSHKVTGEYMGRSIMNLEPATRFIAPPDLTELLIQRLMEQRRITFDYDALEEQNLAFLREYHDSLINTAPLAYLCSAVDLSLRCVPKRRSIDTARVRLKNCDLYQTVYISDPHWLTYRASITGDILIIESISGKYEGRETPLERMQEVVKSQIWSWFGIGYDQVEQDTWTLGSQKFGKIVPMDDEMRRAAILALSVKHDIYSLGRFATWRNILLDDIPGDVRKIQSLIEGDHYFNILREIT